MNRTAICPSATPDAPVRRLSVWLAGRVPLGDYVAAVERLAWEVGEPGGRGPTLLLCEHGDAISIGRSGSRVDVAFTDDELQRGKIDLRFVGRGGPAVPHVEGQLTVGLFARLEDLGLSRDAVGGYLERFEAALAGAVRSLRCMPLRHPGRHGIFGRSGLLAAVGVAVRRGVVRHGAFLNVCPSMRIVHRVRTSAEGPMGSIEADLQRRARPADVRSAIVQQIGEAFGIERTSIQSGFPVPLGEPPRRAKELVSRVG